MNDPIDRQSAIDTLKMDVSIIPFAKAREYVRVAIDEIHNRLVELPSAQPEITDEQAIEHLQKSGWMQNHDRQMYEMGLRERLADDSGSYDALLPSAQPDNDKRELVRTITAGIVATSTKDVYSCGMRNGMRWCRALLEEGDPKFEDASLYAQPERKKGKWIHGKEIARECLSGGVTYIEYEDWHCSECGYTVKRIRWNADGELVDRYCSFCGADLRETKL